MFLLAGLAAGSFVAIRRGLLRLPVWLEYLAVALAGTIAVSGVGYLFLLDHLAIAAWASLPLLLAWVTGAGINLGDPRRA